MWKSQYQLVFTINLKMDESRIAVHNGPARVGVARLHMRGRIDHLSHIRIFHHFQGMA